MLLKDFSSPTCFTSNCEVILQIYLHLYGISSRGFVSFAYKFKMEYCVCNDIYIYIFVQVFYKNSDVKQVDVPSFSGSFGILPDHVPLIAVLKPGVLTVHEQDGNNKRYFGTANWLYVIMSIVA